MSVYDTVREKSSPMVASVPNSVFSEVVPVA